MAKAITLTRIMLPAVDGAEALRTLLVIGSAMSLIFAGPALPL